VRLEYERIWQQIGNRQIEALVDLPVMTNLDSRATVDVLTDLICPALYCDEKLSYLAVGRIANLSLEHGNTDASCIAYAYLNMAFGAFFGDYQSGYRFGKLGLDLVDERGLRRFEARVQMAFGNLVVPWTQDVRMGQPLVRRGFDTAMVDGDIAHAAFCCNHLITNLLASGEALGDVQREAEERFDLVRKAKFGFVADVITGQLALVRALRGQKPRFDCINDTELDEGEFERHLEEDPQLANAACWYWIRKLQARFFFEDNGSAFEAALKAQDLLWTSPSFFEGAEYQFFGAIARAAHCDEMPSAERTPHVEAIREHHRQIESWAQNCPGNFSDRAALVGAEIARLEGRELEAERLYENAIELSRGNRFIHIEAIAHELAARFYMARGFHTIAYAYLRNARCCYDRWGAHGKVQHLDRRYPRLQAERLSDPSATLAVTPLGQSDLATVLKVSQTVSGETDHDRLIEKLMVLAIEHAGAQRGLLILLKGDEPRIEAVATAGRDVVTVRLRQSSAISAELPEFVLRYVIRTRDSVVLDDASAANEFSADAYIGNGNVRSVLCSPLLKQGKLVGVLYLENNLTPYAFTPSRIAVLKLLATQAAISLESARLNIDLQQAQAELHHSARLATMGELAASIAHEVNQPLMAAVTNAATCLLWLENDRPDLEEARKAAERVIENGHHAGAVVRSIYALARKSPPGMAQVDINRTIRDVLDLLRAELHRNEVMLEAELQADLRPIVGDRIQLQQVILNLTMNGIEAMGAIGDRPRLLRIRSQTEGPDGVLISVEDSGSGLDPATVDRIFDPLFTTKAEGMGMGLSICRSVVEAHRGRLWASPLQPWGSIFRFTLPAVSNAISIDQSA
jgi:signal transduction histidine kinase